jgi:hypothetical protein
VPAARVLIWLARDGLLSGLTKNVLEAGLEAEMSEHLGYDRHDPAGKNTGNSRNDTRSKKVLTDVGPVEIEVPRDRDGSFEPQLVKKHQRRLTRVVPDWPLQGLWPAGWQAPPIPRGLGDQIEQYRREDEERILLDDAN